MYSFLFLILVLFLPPSLSPSLLSLLSPLKGFLLLLLFYIFNKSNLSYYVYPKVYLAVLSPKLCSLPLPTWV